MNRVNSFALNLVGVFALLFSSCEKAPYITMNGPLSYTFTREGGSQSFTFSCNRDWNISSSESWIRVSPSSGAACDEAISVTITCSPNQEFDPRNASVTLRVADLMETISITQETNLGLLVPQSTFNLSQKAQTLEVKVQSNVGYSVLINPDCDSWISQVNSKALSTDKLFFRVAANGAYEKREGTISIQQNNGDLKSIIHIIQRPSNIVFADALVEELLVKHYDTDLDGGISMEEAQAVKVLSNVFLGAKIKSFDEFQYFTGLTQIANAAFCNCVELKSITLPETIIDILEDAFLGCSSLLRINFPDKLKRIGVRAFLGCVSLESVDLPDGLTDLGISAFSSCHGIKSLVIPATLQDMAPSIFYNCAGLESVVISDGIKSIGRGVFSECINLRTVELPDSVTNIEDDAFFDCGLSAVIVPKNVCYLGSRAFCVSNAKKIVVYGETPAYFSADPFPQTRCPIYVPAQCVEDYKTNECWSLYAERILPMIE